MSEVPEVIQSLFDNRLDMLLPRRDPAFVGQYQISNRMVNSLAHLVGTDGMASHLVAADSFGNLRSRIVDADGVNKLKVDTTGNLHAGIWAGDIYASIMIPALVGNGDDALVVASYYEKQIHTILSDVYNAVDHALTTKEAV